jgi:anti-anti-sigma factor
MRPGNGQHGVEIEQVGDVALVRFTRQALVDEEVIYRVGGDLTRLVEELGYHRMVINLGAVERMSSAMFGQLLGLWRKVQAASGRLVLCCTRPEIAEALAILRLNEVIPAYDKEQDALQSF